MRIQILSDLHLEPVSELRRQGGGLDDSENSVPLYNYEIPVQAEYLALLGDIGCTWQRATDELDNEERQPSNNSVKERTLYSWLREQLSRFKIVFFVPGNHESHSPNTRFVKWSVEDSISALQKFAEEVKGDESLGDFVLPNRTRYDLSPSLTILGCTLWSAPDPDFPTSAVNDFKFIDFKSTDPEQQIKAYNQLHRTDLDWLNTTATHIAKTEPDRKIAIFTHHAPTVGGTSPPNIEALPDGQNPTKTAYSTDLTKEDCWTSGAVELWAFGHTHHSCDFVRKGVRVYSNQRGYREGAEGYDAGKVVELE